MTDTELIELTSSIRLRSWIVSTYVESGSRLVSARIAEPPPDSRTSGAFDGLEGHFAVPESWTARQVYERLFCTIQYLQDHELREQFVVGDARPFDPHDPRELPGLQKDWFVEAQSAMRGF